MITAFHALHTELNENASVNEIVKPVIIENSSFPSSCTNAYFTAHRKLHTTSAEVNMCAFIANYSFFF